MGQETTTGGTTHGPDRRRVLVGGVAVAGLAGIAACNSATDDDTAAGGRAAGEAATRGPVTLPVSEVPEKGGVILADHAVVVTQPEKGTFKAFDTACPHAGCQVTSIKAGNILCPCHGSVFDGATGEPTAGPAKRPLEPRTVTREGQDLRVD